MKLTFYHRIVWIGIFLCAIALGIYAYLASTKAAVLVEWSTASELDTAGYNIYRSESPDGKLLLLNDQLIPGSADPWVGADYSFTDNDVIPGARYYYWLEDVGLDGGTSRHGPVEIDAVAGGKLEMVIALLLVVIAGGGLWFSERHHRQHVVQRSQQPVLDISEN